MLTAPEMKGRSAKKAAALLSITWIVALLLGAFLACLTADSLQGPILGLLYAPSSPVSVLLPAFLPFLITVFAVYFFPTGFIAVICGAKAFCFGFCSCGIAVVYGQGSWLVCLLTMFTDIFSVPVLCLYWLRCYSAAQRPTRIANVCFGFSLLAICATDYCFVTPFVEYLLSI